MKTATILRGVVVLLLLAVVTLCVVSCDLGSSSTTPNGTTTTPGTTTPGTNPSTTNPPVTPVTISVSASASSIAIGEKVQLTADVQGTDITDVIWTVSDESLVSVNMLGELTVIGELTIDKIVKVTATSVADPTVSAFKTIIVNAPRTDGRVGELTSEMIAALGNQSITATGTLTDYYQDFKNSANNSTHVYNMMVQMNDGAWKGTWSQKGSVYLLTDNYRRGDDGYTDQAGNYGHALMTMYIDRHNEVTSAVVKDYMSIPGIWESQHLWNHLGNLDVNRFTYDPEKNVYKYTTNMEDADDLYLMTYISYSLTPMLSDTVAELYLTVEDGRITKLTAQTEVLLYGENTEEDPDAMSYTVFEVTFSEIGTTTVPDPTPYEAPEYADKLTAALANMGNAHNYTYKVVDTATNEPSYGDDYTMSVPAATAMSLSLPNRTSAYRDYVSSVGTVGAVGYVTADAILVAKTGKYAYSMDGNDYYTHYTGLKQNADGTYEEFAYSSKDDAFYGTRKLTGNIFDNMPTFDFSANIFEFEGMHRDKTTGRTLYTFSLIESAITRDVAMQVSAYGYADDAEASAGTVLQIVVDDAGNLISTTFPYSIVGGVYMGYCTTTYSNVGTTALEEGTFDNYIPRVLKTSWSEYTMDDYYYLFSTQCKAYGCYDEATGTYDHSGHTATADVVLQSIFGDQWTNVPAPDVLFGLFGDNIHGPWYDYKVVGTDADGKDINHGYISINTTSAHYDENGRITDYPELMAEVQRVLEGYGFSLSLANTDTTGGESGQSARYVTFIKGDIQIVFENLGTKYIYIDIYKTGDWTLKR